MNPHEIPTIALLEIHRDASPMRTITDLDRDHQALLDDQILLLVLSQMSPLVDRPHPYIQIVPRPIFLPMEVLVESVHLRLCPKYRRDPVHLEADHTNEVTDHHLLVSDWYRAVLSAPTRPRGGPGFARDDSREYAYRGGPSPRGGRGGFGGPPTRYDYPPSGPRGRGDFQSGPPSGPHDHHAPPLHHSYSASRGGSAQSHHAIPGFRPNNSSSGTYPRTQRFPQLASVPAIIEGGKKLPTMLDPGQEKRLQQLEEDKKKLMEAIEEKQRVKRMGLRDWERGEREIRREGLKSELAEQSLERLSGEGDGVVSGGGGAAY
ncbi:hypothetical protein MMC25_000873 [Agyrium rufum]|nr:hypothetical protein [Agyrium rufum]